MGQENTTLDDISAIIGFSATIKICAWFGGFNMFVPQTVEEGQVLSNLVGMSAAKMLKKEWGGRWIAVPSLSAYDEEMQRRFIGRMLTAGMGCREISLHVKVGERRVQQVCRELEQAGLIPIQVRTRKGRPPGKTSPENPPANGNSVEKAPEKTPFIFPERFR